MKVAQQRWALAAASAVVTAALAGLAWSLIADRHERPPVEAGSGFAPAGALGYLLKPNTESRHATDDFDVQVVTNSLGLRGVEVVVPKPSDRYRVLALGDSFTFGWGVALEDAWHSRMAEELQASGERSLEVVDAGVPGSCPLQQFVFLDQRGLELQPDLVLWQLCVNDLLEMERLDVEIDEQRLPVAVAAEPPMTGGLRTEWLAPLQRLEPAVRERVQAEYRAGRIDPALRAIMQQADAARREQAGPAPAGRISELSVDDVLRGLRTSADFRVRYIDHMVSAVRARCIERGIALRLMLVQSRRIVGGADEPDDGRVALRAWVARQSPTILDTAAVLTAERAADFYFSNDPHWTPAAHREVARAVARWLAEDTELGLSPTPAGRAGQRVEGR